MGLPTAPDYLFYLSQSLSASEIKHFIATRIEVSFCDILTFGWTSNRTYRLAQTPSYKSALYVPLEFLSKNRDIIKILPNLTKVAPIHTPPYMFYTQSCFSPPPAKKRREFEIDKQAKYRAQLTSTQT